MRRITREQLPRVLRMRADGKTYATIARVIGCSRQAAYRACKRAGVEPPAKIQAGAAPKRTFRRFSEQQVRKLVRLRRLGLTYREIAEHVPGHDERSVMRKVHAIAKRNVQHGAAR